MRWSKYKKVICLNKTIIAHLDRKYSKPTHINDGRKDVYRCQTVRTVGLLHTLYSFHGFCNILYYIKRKM